VQVNSATGSPRLQLKAPAAMCIVLRPSTAGETVKMKLIVVSPFDKKTLSAWIPFTVKSVA